MALIVDQQSNFKHFCKICKKGFLCGRALGGHMRAHGIGDENGCLNDDDQAIDWEDKSRGGGGGNTSPSNKRMYALRTNPNRQRSCRACENCGKEFSSWKSFLEHGKCSSDDVESPLSSPESHEEDEVDRRPCRWSKRKRSFRTNLDHFAPNNCPSSEDEDLAANCLMMLSNGMVDTWVADQPEESCASASKDEERRHPITFTTPIVGRITPILDHKAKGVDSTNLKGMFECKACKKVFNSHQALGGHRASHKKVKGCFAARLDHVDQDSLGGEDNLAASDPDFMRSSKSMCTTLELEHGKSNSPVPMFKRKSKVHECSICHRVFSSGQALGGHKRCHWITSNVPDPSTIARFQELQEQIEQVQEMPMFNQSEHALDLNMPASHEDMIGTRRDPRNSLSFEVSTEIFLQSWGGVNVEMKHDCHRHHHSTQENENEREDENNETEKKTTNDVYESNAANNKEDEADSKVKLTKLCDIKDHMSTNGCSSPWLQVGISSSNNAIGANP